MSSKQFQFVEKQQELPPEMPGHFLELCPEAGGTRRWEQFWKTLHKLEKMAWKKRGSSKLYATLMRTSKLSAEYIAPDPERPPSTSSARQMKKMLEHTNVRAG
ncbi:hypothetical protein JCM33374_g5595 [Metschnikowia sp. JCM 33374]|nr:hypothetical protein JCM33374_g5595 [Metschnikowia sp. JCM 33374]